MQVLSYDHIRAAPFFFYFFLVVTVFLNGCRQILIFDYVNVIDSGEELDLASMQIALQRSIGSSDMDPGPSDGSVLTRQAEHRSTWIWDGPDEGEDMPGVLKCRHCFVDLL
nr:hypothetical protein CFP56_05225 [Quercus suber]